MNRVLIAGATGYLGGHIAEELKKQQYFVRAIARDAAKLKKLHPAIDEVVQAEVTKPATLYGHCTNIDAVITTVGITRQKDNLTYMDVDYNANRNLLNEAKRSGVKRFIYIFIFNADKIKRLKIVEAKQKFAAELRLSGLHYCIINPTGFFSDMSEFLKLAKKGTVTLFGKGDNKINPIDGRDLAEVCVKAIDTNEKEINIGGPQLFTYKEIAEMAFRVLNKPIRIRYVPLWMKKVILLLLRTFTKTQTYGPVEFLLTMLTTDMIAPEYGSRTLENYFKDSGIL